MEITSESGVGFGIVGFQYGEPKVTSVTFMIDGRTRVCDHRGNEMREMRGSHAEVIVKLKDKGYDWYLDDSRVLWLKQGKSLICIAGFPQLPYDELKELPILPPTPLDELANIRDKSLRADALKARREANEQLEEVA